MADTQLDPDREALLRALHRADIDLVIIGGAAIQTHDETYRTEDVDVTPGRSQASLRRLAAVLNDLGCKLVVTPHDRSQDVPLPPDFFTPASLARQNIWNLMTRHGKLDITFEPSGFPDGYEQLRDRAQLRRVAQTAVEMHVADLGDVEHSKRTAGRPKDRRYLTQVGRLSSG